MKLTVYLVAVAAVVVAIWYRYSTKFEYVVGKSEEGLLRGVDTSTWRGTRFFSFKGIPYARAPVGEMRFKAPVRSAAWSGVRDAVYHGSICPQKGLFGYVSGNENCLFLNVYTPSMKDDRLPVMVWIHGGGFSVGSADDSIYGPDMIIDEGVVLVTLNYRLGALGFLNTKDGVIPGNAGLKDQNLALQWVQRNIANFGGDPKKVTLFGESAGAASVNFHILSPKSKGLFARAISQSGAPLNPWAQSSNGDKFAKLLAENLGLKSPSSGGHILEHLQSISYDRIVRAQEEIESLLEPPLVRLLPFLFRPTVETNVDPAEAFLPNSTIDTIESGSYNKVPHIMGHNSDEGLLFVNEYTAPENREAVMKSLEKFVPLTLNLSTEEKKTFVESLKNVYFPEGRITDENVRNLIDLYSDHFFVNNMNRMIKLYRETSGQPIYHYIFSYEGGFNYIRMLFRIKLPGAAHGDEVPYMFFVKYLWFWKPAAGSVDEFVSQTLVRLWTNFAKYNNPTPEGDAVSWKPVTKDEAEYLHMTGEGFLMKEKPISERMLFWRNLPDRSSS